LRIRIGNRRYAPGLIPALAVAALLPVLVALGVWQLHRADEKRALAAAFEVGSTRTVALADADPGNLTRYQHVSATGHYDGAHQVLLDNMPSASGRPGYQVLTPFVLETGGLLLVNRGWLPVGSSRAELPDVSVSAQTRSIRGRMDRLPEPGIRLDAPPESSAGWPRVVNYPTTAQLEALIGKRVVNAILLLDAGEPDGFERAWRLRLGVPAERHVNGSPWRLLWASCIS
jgi:surfeit locus 1 family protein